MPWKIMPTTATRLVSSESVRELTRMIAMMAEAICALIGVRETGCSLAKLLKSAPSRAMA